MKALFALLGVAIAGLFGWHASLRGEAIERVSKIPSIAAVNRAVPVDVRINLFTNHVEVALDVAYAAEPKDLIGKLGSAVGSTLAAEYWPIEIEKELAEFARERNDFYAHLIPYRASVAQ